MTGLSSSTALLVEQPVQWCVTARQDKLNLFAVIDPPIEGKPVIRTAANRREINLFAQRTANPLALAITPRLLAISADEASLRSIAQALAQQSAELPEVFLIASELTLEALAARLDKRLDVDASGNGMFLRWWDARTFVALPAALAPSTRQTLFGFGTRALVPDRQGSQVEIELSGAAGADPLERSLELSQRELDELTEQSSPDVLLGMVRHRQPHLIERVPHVQRHSLARQQRAECVRRGLHAERDQALALMLAMEQGAHWWDAPQWASCVQEAQRSSLIDACAKHTEELR
jgi:hypothetical protein